MNDLFSHTLIYFPVVIGAFAVAAIRLGVRSIGLRKQLSGLQVLISWYIPVAFVFTAIYLAIWGLHIPELLDGFWRSVVLTVVASMFIMYCNVRAASLAMGEVTLTAPIQSMTPGMISVLGLALNEFPGVLGLTGISILIFGSFIFSWEKAPEHWWEYFGPFRRLRLLLKYRQLSADEQSKTMAVVWAFGSATFGTFGLLFDGLMTRRGQNLQGLTLAWGVCAVAMASVFLLWYSIRPDGRHGRSFAFLTQGLKKPLLLPFVIIVVAWIIHIYAINPAFQHTYVAHIGALKRLSVPITVVLGFWLFREQNFVGPIWHVVFRRRFWVGILVLIGVAFIVMDDLPGRIATKIEVLGL